MQEYLIIIFNENKTILIFSTDDTQDLPQYQKDKIECADFGSLKSKLYGVNISKEMLTLLQSL